MASIEFVGQAEVLNRLQVVGQQLAAAGSAALYAEGNRIMGVSHGLVPIDTGLLRMTGYVFQPAIKGTEVEVELRYGAYGLAPYALLQHEANFDHPHGGQRHYLSEPFFAATSGMVERLGADIRTSLGGLS